MYLMGDGSGGEGLRMLIWGYEFEVKIMKIMYYGRDKEGKILVRNSFWNFYVCVKLFNILWFLFFIVSFEDIIRFLIGYWK